MHLQSSRPNLQSATAGGAARSNSVLRVKRVTLPRYEVEYRDQNLAITNACGIRDKRTIVFPFSLEEAPGAQIVLDLSVIGQAFSVSLLFRVIARDGQQTILEWWARRQTDPALLDLWIESLNPSPTPDQAQTKDAPEAKQAQSPQTPEPELSTLYDLCRRALSQNPFTALGIHWSASPSDIFEAHQQIQQQMCQYNGHAGLRPRAKALLQEASRNMERLMESLSTDTGRRAARARFVPKHQLIHARELLESQIAVARVRQNDRLVRRLERQLKEI